MRARADRAAMEPAEQEVWTCPDFSQLDVATTMVAELLCESIDLRPGQSVLDAVTRSGNAALAAARRGCEVWGLDSVPPFLDRARERARAERLQARFQVGDIEAIPFPDATFDVVLCVFGTTVMSDRRRAATELLRVCRRGGTIALTNWTANGFIGAILQGVVDSAPPTRESSALEAWGTEQGVRALFEGRVGKLIVSRRSFVFRYHSSEIFLGTFRAHYGSAFSALQVIDAPGRDPLSPIVTAAVRRFDRGRDGTLVAPADYLEVVATKR